MIAVGWLACRTLPPLPEPFLVGRAEVVTSALVPTVVTVSFDAPSDGVLRVERDGELERELPAPAVDGRAAATVLGLKAGATYSFVPGVAGVVGPSAELRVADAPPGVQFESLVLDDRADLAHGWLVMALTDPEVSYIAIVDGDGDPVWWVEADPDWTMSAPRLTRDGRAILYAINDRLRATEDQRAVRIELDGSATAEFATPAAHHMVAELDGGELAWLAWDIREVPWDGGVLRSVLGDRLLVGDGIGEPRELLSFFDDRGPAYIPCHHALIRDERLGTEVYEWTHGNSVVWLEDTDQLLIVARLIDAVLLVDRPTGQIVWQVGGRDATLDYADPAMAFSHGHLSEAWDGGFLMFDNGSHRDPPVSRIVEHTVDGATVSASWVYDDPLGRLTEYLGDAHRLPSDDVVVAWSPFGTVEELTRDGEVLWRIQSAVPGMIVGRVQYLPSLSVGR